MSDLEDIYHDTSNTVTTTSLNEAKTAKRWKASEPPEEVWTSDGDSGTFQLAVIGEEIDLEHGSKYEVWWYGWKGRSDGTKTTWETAESLANYGVNLTPWKEAQQKLHDEQVKKSLEIDIHATVDIHNTETRLASQAYAEKLQEHISNPTPNRMVELIKLRKKHEERRMTLANSMDVDNNHSENQVQGSSRSSPFSVRSNQRSSTRVKTQASLKNAASANFKSPKQRSSSSTTAMTSTSSDSFNIATPSPALRPVSKPPSARSSTLVRTPTPLSLDKGKKKDLSRDKGKAREVSPVRTPQHREVGNLPTSSNKRVRVKAETRDAMDLDLPGPSGSSVHSEDTIVSRRKRPRLSSPLLDFNDRRKNLAKEWSNIAVKNGAAPLSFTNTVDAEALPDLPENFQYIESHYEFDQNISKPDSGFLESCDCISCDDPSVCKCQENRFDNGQYLQAYTPEFHGEVVECNQSCKCYQSGKCRNRVAQQPRVIPIDIFKTSDHRGWGARSFVDVDKGKILALYTGQIMSRKKARNLRHRSYVYDLDDPEVKILHSYSVDSRCCGNWTRFLNHSCIPNLSISLFVHDVPPACGMPFIAFVANQHIPAGTEFTIEYDPCASADYHEGKHTGVKGKKRNCLCGCEGCRGFVNFS
ncbi:hypothetical protein CPB83DRAFT_848886 [Crepidotus variabilis]|uniref:Histone-lysine N-methyltransferase n=1 Tax=Crepidotus variabilis TaxID=179855 RepID=A0A9P6JSH6_9AGAR|nr:hypothetical protein CPB83DRAFT_848886 [Crepidotus variabilis]